MNYFTRFLGFIIFAIGLIIGAIITISSQREKEKIVPAYEFDKIKEKALNPPKEIKLVFFSDGSIQWTSGIYLETSTNPAIKSYSYLLKGKK